VVESTSAGPAATNGSQDAVSRCTTGDGSTPSCSAAERGGQRRRAPGAGSKGLLSAVDRVLLTVVYLRRICSQNVLSDLLGINTNSIG
jgi:hypothetical protein